MVKQLWFSLTVMGNSRLENALMSRFGKIPTYIIMSIIKNISLHIPLFFIRTFPSSICALLLSAAFRHSCGEKRFTIYINKISKSKHYKKYYIHSMAKYKFDKYGPESAENFLNSFFLNNNFTEELRQIIQAWVLYNLNQNRNFLFQKKIKKFVESTDLELPFGSVRLLPDHTRHMGHLGFLFLYANYYRMTDPSRVVQIFPNEAANKFYLDELLKIFPLKVDLLHDTSYKNHVKLTSIDNMFISRIGVGNWRFEPLMAAGTGQNFPEFLVDSDFKLESNLEFSDISIDGLKKIGFDSNKWFIILHVKEDHRGYKVSGETRDSSIENYELSCQLIKDLGGQVVRMGGPNFPKLNKNFPAIDYAHSIVRSEHTDYWLWANCKFWIGNGNGASIAVIPFKKPRLVTDHWPWDPNGPSYDLFLPKLAYDNRRFRFLTPKETTLSELGRLMNRSFITSSGMTLIDNSPELIKASTLEMFQSLDIKKYKKIDVENHIDLEIYSATHTPISTPRMQLPNAFKKYYEEQVRNYGSLR